MKIKFLPLLWVGLLIIPFLITSCLDDEVYETTYVSESSITSFSLGILNIEVIGKDKDGNDSVYTDTMSMGHYPFTIDQLNRTIENKDSLPVGTDISKVVVDINADTNYIIYGKISEKGGEAKDTLWTETDSIDFSVAPVEGLSFKVMAYSGALGKPYHVKINVHRQDPDSLQWSKETMGGEFASGSLVKQKAIYLNETIYVFGEAGNTPVVEYTSVSAQGTPGAWTAISLPQGTDTYSATRWQDKIFFLANHQLYEFDGNTAAPSSLNPSDFSLEQLLAGVGNTLLYAYTTDGHTATCRLDETGGTSAYQWGEAETGSDPLPNIHGRFSAVNIPVIYNADLTRTVILGYDPDNTLAGFAGYRLSNDHAWSAYNYEQADTAYCPNIIDPTMLYYNKKLYAFGGNVTNEDYQEYRQPFSTIFCSTDNGLTWDAAIEHTTFATEGESFASLYNKGKDEGECSYSCTVDGNNFIWIIWHDGYMSRGRINHLGFASKWE